MNDGTTVRYVVTVPAMSTAAAGTNNVPNSRQRIEAAWSVDAVIDAVPHPAHRADRRRLAELVAQTRDVLLHGVRRQVVTPVRHRVQQLVLRHEPAGIQNETLEDGPFALRQFEQPAGNADLAMHPVELRRAENHAQASHRVGP